MKWEYATDAVPTSDMAARGREGWELIAVHDGIAFFKRMIEEVEAMVAPPPAPSGADPLTTPLKPAEKPAEASAEELPAAAPSDADL